MTAWKRLIRFVATDGRTLVGEPELDLAVDVGQHYQAGKALTAVVIDASKGLFSPETALTTEKVTVKTLLGPLTSADVPVIKCIGLNYMKHIKEGGRTPPPYPSVFFKAAECVADYGEPIPIPSIAQHNQLDYEGELCVVIGKDGKNISVENALDHVAGYTAGNDISARTWQRDPKFAGGVPQWCFSKSFDKFAPLGPALVAPSVIPDPSKLTLQTRVNGEIRQDTETSDLLFNVATIIAFISQGSTLRAGTVIMTGTPSGVAMGMASPKYLNDGDQVEVSISQIGTLVNKMQF